MINFMDDFKFFRLWYSFKKANIGLSSFLLPSKLLKSFTMLSSLVEERLLSDNTEPVINCKKQNVII